MTDEFEFRLSSNEVLWLAKALNYASLHLPQDMFAFIAPRETKEALNQAQESLKQRGLIQPSGDAWQVDRLPAAILRAMASAEGMTSFKVQNRSREKRRANLFQVQGMILLVSLEDEAYHFLFGPDPSAMSNHLLNWISASTSDIAPALPHFTLFQPEVILPAAWTDAKQAERMLKVVGHKPKEIKNLLAWAGTQEWITVMERIVFEEGKAQVETKAYVCGNSQNAWAGCAGIHPDDVIQLQPTGVHEIVTLVKEFV